jgi:hypothetical protein
MALNETGLRAAAQGRYERGRLRSALQAAWFVPVVVTASLWGCPQPEWAVAGGALIAVLLVFMRWRGGAFDEAARAGLTAGLAPFLFPLLAHATGHPCSGSGLCMTFTVAAVGGGVLAGALAGAALRQVAEPGAVASALSLAALLGALGCASAGLGTMLGMGAALFGLGVPTYLVAHARRSG